MAPESNALLGLNTSHATVSESPPMCRRKVDGKLDQDSRSLVSDAQPVASVDDASSNHDAARVHLVRIGGVGAFGGLCCTARWMICHRETTGMSCGHDFAGIPPDLRSLGDA